MPDEARADKHEFDAFVAREFAHVLALGLALLRDEDDVVAALVDEAGVGDLATLGDHRFIERHLDLPVCAVVNDGAESVRLPRVRTVSGRAERGQGERWGVTGGWRVASWGGRGEGLGGGAISRKD